MSSNEIVTSFIVIDFLMENIRFFFSGKCGKSSPNIHAVVLLIENGLCNVMPIKIKTTKVYYV